MQISVEAYNRIKLKFLQAGFPSLTGKVMCKCNVRGARK
jgi:hypothetical protein